MIRYLLTGGCCAMLGVLAIPPSDAQESTAASTASAEPEQLSEIIVSAQRRRQNLQEVPISVTSFNADTLRNSGVSDVMALSQLDSSANFSTNTGSVIPYIRGIGNRAANIIGNEASVPVYIDDVYYTRLSPAYLQLPNVDRVEVLKGPQGTLFGRNATGGAIQLFTQDPGQNLVVHGKAGYANYNTYYGDGYVGGPLGEGISADLAVSGSDQRGGWGRNVFTGEAWGRENFVSVRSKVLLQLTDTTKVRFIVYYASVDSEQGLNNDVYDGTISGTPPLYGPSQRVYPLPNFYDTRDTLNNRIRNHSGGGSIKIDQELGFADFTSISAYRTQHEIYYPTDGDGQSLNYLMYSLTSEDRQISEELQLKSKPGQKITWIAGAFYLNSLQGYDPVAVRGDAIAAGGLTRLNIFGRQFINSYAGYGQVTVPVIDDSTNVTAGLRLTKDKVQGIGNQDAVIDGVGVFPAQTPYDKTFDFNKVTYKIGVDHKFAPDILGYASYSTGYKSGTFNTLPLTADPTQPETVKAYEIGLKTELWDHRIRVNGAIFQDDIGHPQVSTVITQGTLETIGLANGDKARVRGAEFNFEALLATGLTLTAGGTYLDATFLDYRNAPFYYPNPDPPYGLMSPVPGNAAGKNLPQAPKWRFTAGAQYNWTVGGVGGFVANADAAYTARYSWDSDNFLAQRSTLLYNASLAYFPAFIDRLSIRVWGKNLSGQRYYLNEQELAGPSGYFGSVASPRTFGVEFGFKL